MRKRPTITNGMLWLVSWAWIAAVGGASETEIVFTSSYDGTEQRALAYVPTGRSELKRPLLVIAHYLGGNRQTAKAQGYHKECEKRGWLCVCPELHGHRTDGRTSFAALEAQHDIVDAIAAMKARYPVDSSRIYLAGRSMGGMLAQIVAAKYPDQFAAIVAGQGISEVKLWLENSPEFSKVVESELGPMTEENAFEYERRSSIRFARNLRYVPLILWHGTNDAVVRPEQTQRLFEAIRKYQRFQPEVHWLPGAAHRPTNYPASWVCDQLQYYQNRCEAGMPLKTRFFPRLSLITDEDKGTEAEP